jgi:hypothetical protein
MHLHKKKAKINWFIWKQKDVNTFMFKNYNSISYIKKEAYALKSEP